MEIIHTQKRRSEAEGRKNAICVKHCVKHFAFNRFIINEL